MLANFQSKMTNLINKIKKIKHFEIYLAIGLACLIAIIYFVGLNTSDKTKQNLSTENDNISTNYSSSEEYVNYLENKLENVLEDIKGVGNVNVIITLEKGFEYVYVTEEETKTTSNGSIITTTNIVLINGQPVLQEEIFPIIKGIVVVADGASDISIKMNILSVLQTIVEVDNSKINILQSNIK